MNDKLKFRVYDKINKKFVYSDDFVSESTTTKLFNFFSWVKNFEPTGLIQECISIVDKNNKDVYEGDIVEIVFKKVGRRWCEVKRDAMGFSFYLAQREDDKSFPMSINDIPTYIEIIGNICEHKIEG